MNVRASRSIVRFSPQEIRDLAIAWVALGLAFTFFLDRRVALALLGAPSGRTVAAFAGGMALSLLTVGVGFLLHELAHKVVAVRFGQVAEFRADYGMLALAIGAGLAGFLFAAPGAVYHRGSITAQENGLIAVAGPVTNLALAVVFVPLLLFSGYVATIGDLGVKINLLLAGFNMLPFGPLDGRKVLAWSTPVYLLVFVPSLFLSLAVLVL